MTTLLETKQLTIPSTWSKRSAAWAVSYAATQTEVDALESELVAFRQKRDANTRETIAALLPEYEARAAALWKRLQEARGQVTRHEAQLERLTTAKDSSNEAWWAWLNAKQKHDHLETRALDLWREYAPLAADMSAMRATWERMARWEEAA